MHAEVKFYLESVREYFPLFFKDVSVLEIGSADVNGSVRELFQATQYIGVDLIPGPGVDCVALGESVQFDRMFDVVISSECFEHNPQYFETFENMVRHTRPGGMVLFTCASTGRSEHGTLRSHPGDSPGTVAKGWNHYRNLEADDFSRFPHDEIFEAHRFFVNRISCDLYFIGLKRPYGGLNTNSLLDQIAARTNGDETNRLSEQLERLLNEVEQLSRKEADHATITVGIARVREKLQQTQRALSMIRTLLEGSQTSRTAWIVRRLPGLRKRLSRLLRIASGI